MKLLVLAAASALALTAAAGSASAQAVTGSVGITGTVTAKCFVGTPANPGGSSFSDTMALGELDQTNGTIRTDLASSTAVAAAIKTFTVTCSGSDATISLSADQFDNTTSTGTPSSGSANKIDYTAKFVAALAAGGTKTVTYSTAGNPAASSDTLGGALANTSNDITISAYSFTPVGGTGELLVAGNYAGTIHVTITPST